MEQKKEFTLGEVMKALTQKEWKTTTVATLLTRLADKGIIGIEKRGKTNYYYAILKKEDYDIHETKTLLSKIYNGSVKNLVASLYEKKEITDQEILELKNMFGLEK